MMDRPAVDVVVPHAGPVSALGGVLEAMDALELRPEDSLVVVHNRPERPTGGDRILHAPGQRSSYFARNRGAERGTAEWVVFLDADVEPRAHLVDRYFDPPPGERVGVMAGGVDDEQAAGERDSAALRYARLRGVMHDESTLGRGRFSFAKTANCAVRRAAFEEVGGFAEGIRSGGDADLCFRLGAAGWTLEHRPEARARHRSRTSLPALLGQLARHGTGSQWVERRHPGFSPRRAGPGLAWWSVRLVASGLRARARGDRERALLEILDGVSIWAFELGRLVPNRARRDRV